jgi:hypothetical protein
MHYLPGILSLLIAVAGWHYLFYSRAAHRLGRQAGGLEDDRSNRQRIRLRRMNGVVMLFLAVAIFAGTYTADANTTPNAFVVVWSAAMLLILLLVLLALFDVLLTARLRRNRTKLPPTQ